MGEKTASPRKPAYGLAWPQAFALAFLAWVVGAATTYFDVAPAGPLRHAFMAAQALWRRHQIGQAELNPELWSPAGNRSRGVTNYDRRRAYEGYTLFATGAAAEAYLMDNDGRIVHRWRRPYSSVYDATAAAKHPVADRSVYFHSVQAVPGGNGDVVAVYEGVGDTPWGYGIVRLDWNSNVVWKNLEPFHHTFDFLPGGGIVAMTHEIVDTEPFPDAVIPLPYIDDQIVWLDEKGKRTRRLRLTEALWRSKYRRLLTSNSDQFLWRVEGDYFHLNDVDYIDREHASALGFGKEGDLLISLRSQNMIAVVDPSLDSIIWARRASWHNQHDPDILPNGHILLFDNRGEMAGNSRLLEYDPTTCAIVWQYGSTREQDSFYSSIRSAEQLLPNGNILVTLSDEGRLLEITRDKEIVWEYTTDIRSPDGRLLPIMSDARKYPKDQFSFLTPAPP